MGCLIIPLNPISCGAGSSYHLGSTDISVAYNLSKEKSEHMSATQLTQAGPSGSFLDEKSHRKLVWLVCFLRQLNQLHDTDEIDEVDGAINTDIDDDSKSISSLEVIQETETATETAVELRQMLVDAIAFVASVERTAAHVVAVAVEELDDQNGIRFRVSMNGEIPESMLSELKELGVLLSQLSTEAGSKIFHIFRFHVANLSFVKSLERMAPKNAFSTQ